MRSALLGLDLGTSSIKVAAFDLSGRLLAIQRTPTPTARPRPGWAEHDAEHIWIATVSALKALRAELPKDTEIEAIAVASVGESGVLIDRQGRAVRPAIAWFDTRAGAQAQWWEEAAGISEINRITGQPLDPHYGVNKLLWIRKNEPSAFSRACKWLSFADYLIYRLAGTCATDRSLASRTMLFDQRRLDWSKDLLTLSGINAGLLPSVHVAGTRVGGLVSEVAQEIDLPAGTPVAIGGHDRLCGAFAARQGGSAAVDSTGSAEAIVLPVDSYRERSAEEAGYASCYSDVVPNQYVFSARVGFAGALIEWVQQTLAGPAPTDVDSIDSLIPAPLSPSGLVIYPSFGRGIGPCWSPATRTGVAVGLTLGHSRGDLLQGFIEGTCFSLRANLEWLQDLSGPISQLRVECGGMNSRVWLQLKADIVGQPIAHVQLEEPTALGAAFLGGVAVNIFPSHAAAGTAIQCTSETFYPDSQRRSEYGALYRGTYRPLPWLLSELHAHAVSTTKVD